MYALLVNIITVITVTYRTCAVIQQDITFIPAVITHEDISIQPILNNIQFRLPTVAVNAGNPSASYSLILDVTYEHSYIGSTVLPSFTKELHLANIPKSTIATIADDGILKGPLVKGDFGLAGLHKGSKPYEYGVMEKYIPSETAVNEYEKQRIVLGYDGKLGLSRGYSEPSSLLQGSYVQYLKQSGLIGESIFAIELRNNAVHGLLSIDDPALNALARKIDQQRPLPKRAVAPKTSYCYLRNSDIALWYCQVNDVRVRNSRSNKKVFEKNIYGQDVSLMTTLPFIVSPQIDILTAIHNHLVAYGNVCSIFRKKQNGYNFLKCRDNRGFDDLDVVFDLTTFGSLRLSKANLFYHSIDRESGSDFYVCTIAAAGLNLGIWRMGLPMLMDKRTVFDMEHKLVYFQELMGNDGDGDERTYVKTLLVGMALMLSVWSVAVVCGNKMYYKYFTI